MASRILSSNWFAQSKPSGVSKEISLKLCTTLPLAITKICSSRNGCNRLPISTKISGPDVISVLMMTTGISASGYIYMSSVQTP